MKIVIFAGGNKELSGWRLSSALAGVLTSRGHQVTLMGYKGKTKAQTGLDVKEVSPSAKAQTISTTLVQLKTELFVSLMNTPVCAAAVQAQIPFIYCEPDGFKEEKAVKDKKAILKLAKKVIVLVKEGQPLNKKTYTGLKASAVVSPAVWPEHYNYQKPSFFKKPNNVVAAGKLAKDNGFDVLLQTWARLAPAHPSWHLTIVGDGLGKTAWNKFIQKNGLSASTEIVPENGDLGSIFRHSDIFVYPVRSAAQHDNLLDAMACKLPCLASDVPGVAEYIINGVNGLVVDPDDEEALTVALDELMVNWGKRVGLAIEAVKIKDRFPLADLASAIEK